MERMRDFGYNAGIAFQVVDDILDVTADEDLLGKPCGTDLKQKTPSIINILWLASGDPEAHRFFATPTPTESESREAAHQLRQSPIVDEARRIAERYAENARKALSEIAHDSIDTAVRQDLISLVDFTLERCQ